MQHLVYLHPGQHLVLSLDRNDDDKKPVVEMSGDMLEMEGSMREGVRDWFFIKPHDWTASWAEYSSTFMGEIWIDAQGSLSRLIVIQGCTNRAKADHYTVINPDCWDVRVRPHNILEVVLYDLNFTYQDEWHWEWSPTQDLDLELLGKDVLSLYYIQKKEGDDPNYRYAMCPRLNADAANTTLCRQHHYWFRFNKGAVDMARNQSEIMRVGDIKFRGRASKFLPDSKRLNMQTAVYVDFRKAKIGRILDTLALKKVGVEPYGGNRNYATASNLPATTNRKKKWSSYKPKKVLPTIKQVVIKRIESEEIDEGCKVLAAQPSATQMVAYDEYDLMKHFDEYPNCHGVPHWKHWD
jgi:hypothetical protein